MKIFVAAHNPMTYESADGIISLHHSEEGAKKAMEKHKRKEIRAGRAAAKFCKVKYTGPHEWETWNVYPMEVLP